MDRTAFKLPFTESGVTKYHCPTCGKGVLQVRDGSFKKMKQEILQKLISTKRGGQNGPNTYIVVCLSVPMQLAKTPWPAWELAL